MTYSTITADNRSWRRTFFLQITGIQTWLTETTIKQNSLATPSQIPCIVPGGISFGETRLDLTALRQVGSTITIEVADVDGSLATLFAIRTRRSTWVTSTTVSKTATTINVANASGLPSSGTVYINGETITYTGKTSTSITGCTRGAHGSTAQKHYGSTLAGPDVYLVPSAWRGRRAAFKATYVDADGIYSATNNIETLMTLRFTEPPQYVGQGRWRLSLEEIGAAFAETQLYFGQRPLRPKYGFAFGAITVGNPLSPLFGSETSERNLLVNSTGTNAAATYVLVTKTNGATLHQITDYPNVKFSWDAKLAMPANNWNPPIADPTYGPIGHETEHRGWQHVCVLNGNPARIVLTLLLSKLGDGTNSTTYDVLPGKERNELGEESWRMGAGFDASTIDITAFEAFLTSEKTWSFMLKEQMSVGDLLIEFCRTEGCFWYVDKNGKLTVKRLSEVNGVSSTQTLSVLTEDIIEITRDTELEIDQQNVANSFLVKANFDPFTNNFRFQQLVVDWSLIDQFADSTGVLEWNSKFLYLMPQLMSADSAEKYTFGGFSAMPVEVLQRMARRVQKATTRPRVYAKMRVAWSKSGLTVGDVIKVTDSRLPSLNALAGVSPTFSEQPCLIVGKEYDAELPIVTFRLMLLDPGYFIAPFAKVASYNAGTKEITLDTTDVAMGTSTPGNHFAVGWDIYIFAVSAAPNAVDNNLIIAQSGTTLTLTYPPSFTPAAGDIIVPVGENYAGILASTAGFKPIDFAYQIDDVETEVIAGYPISRWG